MRNFLLIIASILTGTVKAQFTGMPHLNFHKADSIAGFYQGEHLNNLPLLAHNLTHNLSDQAEQFRAIYTWVSKNIENDYLAYLKNKKKRETLQGDSIRLSNWNRSFTREVFRTLLKEQKTVCTGYAYLVKELASLAGIHCKIINGYARTSSSNVKQLGLPNHSWNAVQLNNQWYLCDPTWSSGNFYSHWGTNLFVQDYNEGYFLANPHFFLMNHYPLDPAWALTDSTPDPRGFLNAPLVYGAAFKYGLMPLAPNTMLVQLIKHDSTLFSFETAGKINPRDIYLEIISGSRTYTIQPELIYNTDGTISIKHTFHKTGYYDLHIKIYDDFISTHTVAVKRK